MVVSNLNQLLKVVSGVESEPTAGKSEATVDW